MADARRRRGAENKLRTGKGISASRDCSASSPAPSRPLAGKAPGNNLLTIFAGVSGLHDQNGGRRCLLPLRRDAHGHPRTTTTAPATMQVPSTTFPVATANSLDVTNQSLSLAGAWWQVVCPLCSSLSTGACPAQRAQQTAFSPPLRSAIRAFPRTLGSCMTAAALGLAWPPPPSPAFFEISRFGG